MGNLERYLQKFVVIGEEMDNNTDFLGFFCSDSACFPVIFSFNN